MVEFGFTCSRPAPEASAKTLREIEREGYADARWAGGHEAGRFRNPYLSGTNEHSAYEQGYDRGST